MILYWFVRLSNLYEIKMFVYYGAGEYKKMKLCALILDIESEYFVYLS